MNLLVAAALLFAAVPAFADPPWYDLAVKDWNEDLQPPESYRWYKFQDEDNVERTLYCKATKNQNKYYAVQEGCQLYVFPVAPPPEHEVRKLIQPESEFKEVSGKLMDVDVVTIKGAQVSPYYIAKIEDSFRTLIGRRDRPETRLPATWSAYDYYSQSGLFPWPPSGWVKRDNAAQPVLSVNGVIPWGRIQVYKPEGVGTASASPMTALNEKTRCNTLDETAGKVPSYRGWLPQELELWIADLEPAVATPGIWSQPTWKAHEDGLRTGNLSAGAPFFKWYRDQAKPGLEAFGRYSANDLTPKDRFTPLESRFLQCRARHVDQTDAFFAKVAELGGDAAKTAGFVSLWRQYVQRELVQYFKDAADVQPLPRYPEYAAVDQGIHARFADALAGKLTGPASSAKPATPAPQQGAKKTAAAKPLNLPDPNDAFR